MHQVVNKMSEDWSSIPEDQHIPVMESMFNLAIKSIGRAGLGKTFKDDKEVRKFGDAYTTVSICPNVPSHLSLTISLTDKSFFANLAYSKKT